MPYRSLRTLYHMDGSPAQRENLEARLRQRLDADSTFRTGVMMGADELFLAVPRELSALSEQILLREQSIRAALERLPPVARGALVRGLVVSEVVSTNEIEGVYSTRRQISDLLEPPIVRRSGEDGRRFRELARLYLGLSEPGVGFPRTAQEVRGIYDTLMDGENLDDDAPDGRVFRAGEVEVIGHGSRVVHRGLHPEARIIQAVEQMISLVASPDIPKLYSAILGHFIFEYAHPFYDGNGRTGRYLLALALRSPLSELTTLTLSRVIAEHKDSYHRSFREAEHPLNHGELTGFVLGMLELVGIAQDELDDDLTRRHDQLVGARDVLEEFAGGRGLAPVEAEIVSFLVQHDLFAAFPDVPQRAVADYIALGAQQTRKYLKRLEDHGVIVATSRRPLRFALTDATRTALGIG